MDQERPRTDLSINSRNDLRKVLHLEFLYRENKDPLRKRSLRRSLASSSKTHSQEEESGKVPELCTLTPTCAAPQNNPTSSKDSVSRSPRGPPSELSAEKHKATPSSPPQPPHTGLSQQDRARPRGSSEDSPAVDGPTEEERSPTKLYLPGGYSRVTQERLERAFKRQSSQPPLLRKNQLLASDKVDDDLGALQLEDVDDTLIQEEVILSPAPSVLKLQIASKPIDLSVAKEIKTLLFGSCFCCFNEEWKLQSFSFSDIASLRYGIVQNKAGQQFADSHTSGSCLRGSDAVGAVTWGWGLVGVEQSSALGPLVSVATRASLQGGPCGVLAAVQGCVLQKLLFEGESGADRARQLQPSDAHRTRCLALAIADILWRAGDRRRAVVALASGTEQFSPTGKYKADGVLETLTLHSLTCYEELVTFLQYSVHQFQAGPYGCVLLTLSAILSRSLELVRQDFDVPTTHLIGAHGYCTQELVNLLLTGRAVSNVFNDVVELDSGNGNITLLRGIAARSDVGFLSLFEHYNVCQVGCFLKTPRFPIWVVCSESHFSVLFSLQMELLSDWKSERLFDLYYYDGLANQQEQIRLTIDTTQTIPEDSLDDFVPPLELCIRTK
ncbi:Protein FAM188B [Sciurus carolinensis]|uniref:Ubiquitin carboxyl-terminal hydrolase MINDY n=1 Tax=Sciurus carolinensis TaxID=30640 RepID=A0AA41MQ30_SCICA|nr:Protein FAM188B [Sciurus carolinensis]